MLEPYSSSLIWLMVLGFVIAFILAVGIGANDVANSFGTSVGSKVITIFQACCLATVFEVSGAILIGYKVSDTMRKGIVDINVYKGAETELMLGSVSALAASAVWLIIATFFKLPISGTHSTVGATVGYSIVVRGTRGICWKTLVTIVGSWFISPLLSGVTSCIILWIITKYILLNRVPLEAGLRALPLFYGFTISINLFSIIHDGPKLLHMDNIPLWLAATISISIGIVVMVFIYFFMVPWQRKVIRNDLINQKIHINFDVEGSTDVSPEESPTVLNKKAPVTMISDSKELQSLNNTHPSTACAVPNLTSDQDIFCMMSTSDNTMNGSKFKLNESTKPGTTEVFPITGDMPLVLNTSFNENNEREAVDTNSLDLIKANKDVARLFSFLQILTAAFGSFAHGGNDVSNAIGPLITLWLIYSEGSVQQKAEVPLYMLLYGGVGISLGLWLWGRRVIETIGEDLTIITPATGFTIEIGAALTVLLASKIGLPISTTHCKVGSVVFVGYFNSSKKGVDWSLFRWCAILIETTLGADIIKLVYNPGLHQQKLKTAEVQTHKRELIKT